MRSTPAPVPPAEPTTGAGRLLLVTQRPIDRHAGDSIRWRSLLRWLPELGWEVETVSGNGHARGAATTLARTPSRRARNALRILAGVARRGLHPLGIEPAALVPDPLWAVRGRRAVTEAIERV